MLFVALTLGFEVKFFLPLCYVSCTTFALCDSLIMSRREVAQFFQI
jgi:hypothetical protein